MDHRADLIDRFDLDKPAGCGFGLCVISTHEGESMAKRKSEVADAAADQDSSSTTPTAETEIPASDEPRPLTKGPNPRAWETNNEAGVEYRTRSDPYEAQLMFREKPSQAVIDYVKNQGFRWNGQDKVWVRPIRFETREQDRLIARRAYDEVVKMALKEKGISTDAEVAF